MSYLALIVEDDAPTRPIYQQILAMFGFSILEAPDGQQALDMLQQHTPDIILLDLRLPRVDGVEVLKYIYMTERLKHTRTVVITAHPEFRQLVHLAPGDEFLVKPIDVRSLRDFAHRALSAGQIGLK